MLLINRYKSYEKHQEKLQLFKQFLIVAACLLDIPFRHTFCNDHLVLTFCLDFLLVLALPVFFCKRVVEALVVTIILCVNLLVRGYLYFDAKVTVIDLVGHILLLLAFRAITLQETSSLLVVSRDREKDITVKNNEFQSILNTFPEGVFMASYKEAPKVEETPLPQGM